MQQNVRLITFPISIFTTITNLAEFCPWKKAILRPLGVVSRKKVAVLLDFVQIRGGGPAQIFCHLLIKHFWSISKESTSSKMPIN